MSPCRACWLKCMLSMSLDLPESPAAKSDDLTVLLRQWSQGGESVAEAVVPLIYNELHWLAGHYLRKERSEHTLQPTALVHEAWMRLVENNSPDFRDRKHFYAIAARLMALRARTPTSLPLLWLERPPEWLPPPRPASAVPTKVKAVTATTSAMHRCFMIVVPRERD